jgi:transcriptional regulator with XRE-family HTH domain
MTLRELREEAMLTQTEVAKLLGVARSTVSLWESGNRAPRLDHMRQLAELYKVSPRTIKEAVAATTQATNAAEQE